MSFRKKLFWDFYLLVLNEIFGFGGTTYSISSVCRTHEQCQLEKNLRRYTVTLHSLSASPVLFLLFQGKRISLQSVGAVSVLTRVSAEFCVGNWEFKSRTWQPANHIILLPPSNHASQSVSQPTSPHLNQPPWRPYLTYSLCVVIPSASYRALSLLKSWWHIPWMTLQWFSRGRRKHPSIHRLLRRSSRQKNNKAHKVKRHNTN